MRLATYRTCHRTRRAKKLLSRVSRLVLIHGEGCHFHEPLAASSSFSYSPRTNDDESSYDGGARFLIQFDKRRLRRVPFRLNLARIHETSLFSPAQFTCPVTVYIQSAFVVRFECRFRVVASLYCILYM